ncbi:hypothetical protein P2318_02280 [Myxococcaceae bacterium GXIMD 01537]
MDPWQFCEGRWLEAPGAIRFPVKPAGQALDFTLASFSIPVVQGRVARLFERLSPAEVQLIPVQVEGQFEPSFILNALRVIRCIDDSRCDEVQHWGLEDGEPGRVGQYRSVSGLRIDPSKVEGLHIFRPWGWNVALIVSETLKDALEAEHVTGTDFAEV